MVKTGEQRAEKVEAKWDPDAITLRYKHYFKKALPNFAYWAYKQAELDYWLDKFTTREELPYLRNGAAWDLARQVIAGWKGFTPAQRELYYNAWLSSHLPESLWEDVIWMAEGEGVEWIPMIEGEGETVHDVTGRGVDGALQDCTWVEDPERGTCLELNGETSHVVIGRNDYLIFGQAYLTLMIRFKTSTPGRYMCLFNNTIYNIHVSGYPGSPEREGMGLYVYADGKPWFIGLDWNPVWPMIERPPGCEWLWWIEGPDPVNDGNWHHICIRKRHIYWDMWVDGRIVGTTTTGAFGYEFVADFTRSDPIYLGYEPVEVTARFQGRIKDFRIYRSDLPDEEIRRIAGE